MIYLKPQQRTIKRGMRGRDVLATKYAMKFALGKKGLTLHSLAGIVWERHLNAFKSAHGIKEPGYGPKTHAAMKPYMAKVPYAVWLWNHYVLAKSPTTGQTEEGTVSKRQAVVNAALYGAQHEPSIHYTQSSSRMYGVRNRIRPPAIPRYEDCSSFATWCYWLAGAADPNGLGYNGQGYTGTLAAHGRRASTSRPGDLVFYGGGFPYTHVAIYIGGGKVVSHGSEHGPIVCDMHYRPVSTIRSYLP
jgi:hypothetical protein